ncbi:MAG: hypothetical protein V4734_12880 [Terriglobus sp.]
MSEHNRNLCEACLNEEYEQFAHNCVHESMAKNDAWNDEFHGFDLPRWDYSAEDHTLTFSENGKARVVCNVITAGSVQDNRWQWSWGNMRTDSRNREGTQPIIEFGREKEWSGITDLFRDADKYTGWECAAVASHILNGQAVYRFAYGDNDEYFAYLVILKTQRIQ